jgi:hypothetical protein
MKSPKTLRNQLLPTLSRTSPVLVMLFALINCILNPTYNSFYFLIIIISLFPLNWVIKHLIVKPIYNLLKVQSLPLLGIGKRPTGATSCTLIVDDISSTSYGMPSGHSQIIWTFGIYIICKIIDKWHKTTKNQDTTTQMQGLGYIWVICSTLFILSIMVFLYLNIYSTLIFSLFKIMSPAIFLFTTTVDFCCCNYFNYSSILTFSISCSFNYCLSYILINFSFLNDY